MTDTQIHTSLYDKEAQSARQRHEEEESALDSVIDAVNEFHIRRGFMSDEFSVL